MKRLFIAVFLGLLILINLLPIAPLSANEPVDISPANASSVIEVSRPIQLTTNPHYDRDSCFLIDKHGAYWLFFTRGRGDPSTPGYNPDTDFYDIYYLKSTDGGVTWIEYSMPSFVNDPYGQREVAAYEIPEIDTIVVFFTDAYYGAPYGTPTYGVYYTYTNDGGATWASVRQVSGVTASHIDVVNAYGKRWLFFEGRDALIYVTYYEAGTWSTPIQISESGKHGGIPKAMIDRDGVFNVVWCGWTEGGIYRATSTDGITWSTPQLILTSSYVACDPVLVQDTEGTYWLFWAPWNSATDSQWIETVYSPDGITWSSSIHVTSGGYGGNYWWDMWPEAYLTPEGDILLFYTSEVATGSYIKGDGNIWMYKINWNLANPHYEFIQNAIAAANPGDTIIVHEGVYEITNPITINKPLIITSDTGDYRTTEVILTGVPDYPGCVFRLLDDADGTVIRGFRFENIVVSAPLGSVISAWHVVVDDLTVESNSFINITGPAISRGGDVACKGWRIIDNKIHNVTGTNISGLWLSTLQDIVINENEISNTTYAGMILDTIEGVIVSNNIIMNTPRKGIQLAHSSNALIENNHITHTNLAKEPDEGAISIYPDCTNVTIERNDLTHNYQGVTVREKDGSVSPDVHVNHNNIYENEGFGIANFALGGGVLDARFNWWGDESGPSGVGPGMGDAVSENATYSPWLGYPYETTPMTYHVDPTGKIQDAIDDSSSGDTIKVYEGTYTEQLIINKSLTLIGDPKPKILAPDTRSSFTIPESTAVWEPIIFAYGSLTGTETISLTIEGFEIDGGNKAASGYRFVAILCRNVKPAVISDNLIHSMYPPSGTGSGPQTFGIIVYGDSEIMIERNEIRDFSRGGIGVLGDAGPNVDPIALINENTVLGNGLESETGWWAENGIQIGLGASGHVINNEVFDCIVNNPYWAATGILVVDTDGVIVEGNHVEGCDIGIGATDFPGSKYGSPWDYHILSNVVITSNVLVENIWQIDVSNEARNVTITYNDILNATEDGIDIWSYSGVTVFPTDVKIHFNNIEGSGSFGVWVAEDVTEPVDARFNWWGDPTGPYHNTTWTYMGEPYGPHYGLGDRVSDYVLYDPWQGKISLKVVPSNITMKKLNQTFTINVTIEDVDPEWRVVGVQFRLLYDATLLEVVNVTEGDFMKQAGDTFFIYFVEKNPFYGDSVVVGILLLPQSDGQWINFPSGSGVLASITFRTIYQHKGLENPPLSCNFTLIETIIVNENVMEIRHTLHFGHYQILPNNIADLNWDYKVDIRDVAIASQAFGEFEGRPRWNPIADINHDGRIDIRDIAIIAKEFGWVMDP